MLRIESNKSHGGTYSGFVFKTLPGVCLLLCFCCVMLELGLVVVRKDLRRKNRARGEERAVGEARYLS